MAKRKAAPARGRKTARRGSSGQSRSKAVARGSRAKARKKTARPSASKAPKRRAAARKTARKVTVKRTARKVRATSARSSAKTKKTALKARKTALKTKTAPKARKAAKTSSAKLPAALRNRAAMAKVARTAPALNRARRVVQDDDLVPSPPSSLDLDRTASAARTGRRELHERVVEHTETSPALTGGDIDADWESAYSVGDEAPGGDNPTPDQDIVDDIGKAIGVQYEDNEELKGERKISDRDRKRWELDPARTEERRGGKESRLERCVPR